MSPSLQESLYRNSFVYWLIWERVQRVSFLSTGSLPTGPQQLCWARGFTRSHLWVAGTQTRVCKRAVSAPSDVLTGVTNAAPAAVVELVGLTKARCEVMADPGAAPPPWSCPHPWLTSHPSCPSVPHVPPHQCRWSTTSTCLKQTPPWNFFPLNFSGYSGMFFFHMNLKSAKKYSMFLHKQKNHNVMTF